MADIFIDVGWVESCDPRVSFLVGLVELDPPYIFDSISPSACFARRARRGSSPAAASCKAGYGQFGGRADFAEGPGGAFAECRSEEACSILISAGTAVAALLPARPRV